MIQHVTNPRPANPVGGSSFRAHGTPRAKCDQGGPARTRPDRLAGALTEGWNLSTWGRIAVHCLSPSTPMCQQRMDTPAVNALLIARTTWDVQTRHASDTRAPSFSMV